MYIQREMLKHLMDVACLVCTLDWWVRRTLNGRVASQKKVSHWMQTCKTERPRVWGCLIHYGPFLLIISRVFKIWVKWNSQRFLNPNSGQIIDSATDRIF
jgi:hypothetical protein